MVKWPEITDLRRFPVPQDIPKCQIQLKSRILSRIYFLFTKVRNCFTLMGLSTGKLYIGSMFPSLRCSGMIVCYSCTDFLIPGLRRRLLLRGRRCRRRGADRPHLVHAEESGRRRMTYFRSTGRTDDSDICPVCFLHFDQAPEN